jgi:hypothetical protein
MRSTISQPAFRRFITTVAVGAALATTSGCGVPADAVTGISVTDDGRLLGVIMVCGHHIDGASLYVDNDNPERTAIGYWTADRPLTAGLTTWPLDSAPPGWTADRSPAALTAGTTYSLYGWTKDNSWSSRHVTFTSADRDRLAPGMVFYNALSADGDETARTITTAEFEAEACQDE